MTVLLSRLAIHYYRPDFAEGQVKLLIQDYLQDLRSYAPPQIEEAIREYRQNAENRFFPTTGQLLGILKGIFAQPASRSAMTGRPLPKSMPNLWWFKPREQWHLFGNWKESNVPMGEKIKHNGKWREPERVVL